jgi:hypothetical protein
MTKGEKTKKQPGSRSSPNKCMVPRKWMKMIARRIFLKVDVPTGSKMFNLFSAIFSSTVMTI